jgi:hypothetical protein
MTKLLSGVSLNNVLKENQILLNLADKNGGRGGT